MLKSQINIIATKIAKQSLIDFTKTEMITPEAAEVFKKVVVENVEIYISGFSEDFDSIP